MPSKPKRTRQRPPAIRRASTPQERGETDYRGGGSGYAQDNLPRDPVAGQRREPPVTPAPPQPVRARAVAVDERREAAMTPDDAKALQQASLRARRRGLH